MRKIITIILLGIIISLVGCTDSEKPITPKPDDTTPISPKPVDTTPTQPTITPATTTEETPATQKLIKFKDINELRQFLQLRAQTESALGATAGKSFARGGAVAMDGMVESAVAAPESEAQDFSQTNVQVQDVDEADFIKNDRRYIYMIADNKLITVDAYDADNAKIISEIKISDSDDWRAPKAKQLFIKDDKLALFIEKQEQSFYFQKYDIEPRQTYRQNTLIQIYDISDRDDPELEEEFEITGRYFQSRMIDNIIYIVTQENTGGPVYINQPLIESDSLRIMPEIYYFDNPETNYQFNTITSIDIDDEEVIDSKTLMLGYSNTLMVSENNIYIAYQKQNYWRWGWNSQYEEERFYDVVVPLLEGELKSDINNIIDKSISEEEKWEQISGVFSDFYNDLEEDDNLQDIYEDMFEEIVDALEEYDTKKALEQRKTIIQKLSIDDGEIEHEAQGEVYGSLLNQFSLDEYKNNLRLATTVNIWNRRSIQYNNVYVLDEDMDIIGEIEGIAEDERIYSTRFLGDRLYMVTFRRTDPFFVIDLSDPDDPEILGELKITGYSDYLHPYDENTIIGIGKEADEEGRVEGVKIALFDVSDVENPEQIDKIEIGDRGSDSAVLHDHKAFLFSKQKNLLVLPVTEITKRDKIGPYRYSNSIWHGAYVFDIDKNGFDEIGKVKHSSSTSDYWNWWNEATVLRSLYMDNNLYTVSNKYIKINDLDDDLEELNTVKLPYSDRYYWR